MKRFILSLAITFGLFFSGTICADSVDELQKRFISVSEKAGKAVVTVYVTKFYKNRYGGGFPDPRFEEFFKEFFGPMPEYNRKRKIEGLGSGFIIDKNGYILTNEHVVDEADEIEITLPDGRKFMAEVVGTDKRSDIAVLKIKGKNLPVVTLGDSDKLRKGQWVIAIGNPFGNVVNNPDPTVTVGVVSALHRSLSMGGLNGRFYGNLIQTDAAINKGNSGGPLLNLDGEVVGINTLIFSTSGGSQGIGFAIPINKAKKVFKQIVNGEEITYPWIGIWIQPVDREIMQQFGIDTNGKGALIYKIQPGSPAERAGLHVGDVVIKIAGNEIRNPHELVSVVSNLDVGQKVDVEVIRDGERKVIKVEIGVRPKRFLPGENRKKSKRNSKESKNLWRGISVRQIEKEDLIKNDLKEFEGVVVDYVKPYSPAYFSGIKKGMFIDEVNKKKVSSVKEFYEVVKDLKGKVLIHTERGYFVIGNGKDNNDEN